MAACMRALGLLILVTSALGLAVPKAPRRAAVRASSQRPRANIVAGVAGLQTWMRRRFPEAFEPILTAEIGEVDCAYVDVNELIHHVVRRATDNDELVRLTLRRVSELLRATPPRRLAVLAIDGPGPLAKVFTQRQRRRKTAAKAERKQGAPQGVDTLSLSPGTPFMLELSDALESFARRRVAFAGGLEQQPAYIVSGAHVAGEGEVKCVEHLLDATEECTPAELTHVLHGSDSDLLLLALGRFGRRYLGGTRTPSASPLARSEKGFL